MWRGWTATAVKLGETKEGRAERGREEEVGRLEEEEEVGRSEGTV